jgi:hypothetical protein
MEMFVNSVYYQRVRRGLSWFAEGTVHWHVMRLGKNVAIVVTVSWLHSGAGLTGYLDNCGLKVHVANPGDI